MAGKTRRDFAKGQTRGRHEDSPKSGVPAGRGHTGEELPSRLHANWHPFCFSLIQRYQHFLGEFLRSNDFEPLSKMRTAYAPQSGDSWLMRRSLTRRDENGGENASGFRKGANPSQARRFAKKRRISSLARACGGLAARDFSRDCRRYRRPSSSISVFTERTTLR